MTAKKVDCIHCGAKAGSPCVIYGGYTREPHLVREQDAALRGWQNAAESIPAEAESDPKCQCTHLYFEHWPARSGNAGGCFRCHCSGFFVAEPVAPVEAKEKCPRCESSDKEFRGTCYDGYGEWKCDDKWHEVAEPKPTPSTPAEQVMAAVNWAMGCSDDDFVKPENAPTYWWRRELAKRAGIIYDGQKYVKPEPDSSSIPAPTPIFIGYQTGFDMGYAAAKAENQDSHSISSEQTFKEWWEALYNKSF